MFLRGLKKSVSYSVILSVTASCLILNPITVNADELSPEDQPEFTGYQEETQSDSTEISEAELTDETAVELPAESEPDMIISDETVADEQEAESQASSEDTENIDQDQYELIDTITLDEEHLIELDVDQDLLNASSMTLPTPLSTRECTIYNYLRARVAEIADGRRSETIINIPVSTLYNGNMEWTAEELGVESTVVDGQITREAELKALYDVTGDKMTTIFQRLVFYCGQDMYWYDKTTYPLVWLKGVEAPANGSYLRFTGSLYIRFSVCSCYRGEDEYHVSADAVARAQTAIANAQAIVDKYAGLSDIEKLEAYRDEICDLVDYNTDSARNNEPYGDPNKYLYVFDNDPSTNVVCTGYSDAFKILCDLSDFSSDVSCITISGSIELRGISGSHMWNIVRIDGINYFIDITNCDSSLIQRNELFMVSPLSGDYSTPYVFNTSIGEVTFTYNILTYMIYDPDRLIINTAPTPNVYPAPNNQI